MANKPELVRPKAAGLYCKAGDFFIDPWQSAARAVITHAHGDHARNGSEEYYCATACAPLLRQRLGEQVIRAYGYGEKFTLGDALVSFHPAGHILGSAQVRIEVCGEVWVVSGDYKRDPDPTCEPFEVVPCHTLITEATFALPIYHWGDGKDIFKSVFDWWQQNRARNVCSVLFCYALGKAQRLLAELGRFTEQPAFVHGAMTALTEIYRDAGVSMLPTLAVSDQAHKQDFRGELILAPPSAGQTPWMKRFKDCSTAFASGWMQIRGTRRMRGYDRGFAISDHTDWPGILRTVAETGTQRVLVTHGQPESLVRFLQERGIEAAPLKTLFAGEAED